MPRHGWLTISLLLTLAVDVYVAARSPAIAPDGVTFIEMARELQRAPLDVMRAQDQHPGYPALVVGAHTMLALDGADESLRPSAGKWIVAGKLVAIACGLGCVALVWLIARRMYDRQIADIASLLAAGLPVLRQNAADVLSDTPHLCAYLLAAWCLQEGFARSSRRWFVAAGMASGCAFWIRPEGLSVAIVGVLLVGITFCLGRLPRRQTVFCGVALFCGTALIAGPYVLLTGKLTSKKDPLAAAQKPVAYEMPFVDAQPTPTASAAPTVQVASAIEVTPAPSGDLSPRIVAAVKKYFVELGYGFGYVVWIPWAFGHFAPGRKRPLSSSLGLLASLAMLHSVLLIWLALMAGYLGHRHVMPIVGVAFPAAAAGIEWLGRRGGELVRRPHWAPQCAFAISLILVAIAIPFSIRPINSVASPIVTAADWIRTESSSRQTLLANSRYPRLYAELNGPIFGVDVTDLGGALQTVQPDFVLLDVDTRAFTPPTASELGGAYEPAFEARGEGNRTWHRVLVFRRVSPTIAPELRAAGPNGLR